MSWSDKPMTNKRQADDKPVTTTKEGKKDKNEKKERNGYAMRRKRINEYLNRKA